MKHGRIICNRGKGIKLDITHQNALKEAALIASICLGLMVFSASPCNTNHILSVSDYLEQGYTPYLTFDEWSMKGDTKLAHITDSCDDRIVLVKNEDSLVNVVRVNNLTHVLTYFKKDWGWYNQETLKGDTCVYDRYFMKDTVIELQVGSRSDGRVIKNMYVKTRSECYVARLHDTCSWSNNELPQWHAMNAHRSIVFELRKGKKASYYLPSSQWNQLCDPEDYYVYPAADTTIFSRSPGLETGILKNYKLDAYVCEKDKDGIFRIAEVMPQCVNDKHALAKYIFQHSGSKVRKMILNDKIVLDICVSAAGDAIRYKLDYPMSNKEDLEKQICRDIPFKFEPATILEQAVPCWYTITIDSSVDEIYRSAEQMPRFPGGEEALKKYVEDNIQYPPKAIKNNIQGIVVVQFVVDKNGKIGSVKVVRSINKFLDREAIRLVKTLPDFTPGRMDGKPVGVWYTLPVNFKLP